MLKNRLFIAASLAGLSASFSQVNAMDKKKLAELAPKQSANSRWNQQPVQAPSNQANAYFRGRTQIAVKQQDQALVNAMGNLNRLHAQPQDEKARQEAQSLQNQVDAGFDAQPNLEFVVLDTSAQPGSASKDDHKKGSNSNPGKETPKKEATKGGSSSGERRNS
jgi:hypothetical protein